MRQRRRAAGTATDDRAAPGIIGEGEFREGGFDLGIGQHRGQHFVIDEAGESIGHGVVFKTALAVLAVVAAVFNGNGDERRQLALRVLGNGEIVERVADQVELAGSVMDDQNGRFGAVFVGGRNIDKNLALFAHRLFCQAQAWYRRRERFCCRPAAW